MAKQILSVFLALVSAFGASQVAADERSFDERVRAFLLENPDVILEALTILSEREAKAAVRAKIEAFPELFEQRTGIGEGREEGKIRVVEFFDYRCAPCKAVHPDLVSLTDRHQELRIEMRQLPILSPGSERAARFALATREVYGDEEYQAVHDALWMLRGPLNEAGFRRIAATLDLDYESIEPLMDGDAVSERIDYNRDVAIALDVVGTPAFVTPDSIVVGSTDVDALADVWLNQ